MNSPIDTISEITLTVQDVQELETELAEYSQIYRDLFGRREQKEQYEVYLQGLMSYQLSGRIPHNMFVCT